MCGGHDVHHILGLVASNTTQPQDAQRHSGGRSNSPAVMEQQVKLMYARGDIDADTFHRMIEMAHSGDLEGGIVSSIHAGHRLAPQPAEMPPQGNQETSPELLARQRQLQEAHAETAQALQRLEGELARLRVQAENAEAEAQLAETDNERARAYLETKQGALFRAEPLEKRIAMLRESLKRIELQRDELTRCETLSGSMLAGA